MKKLLLMAALLSSFALAYTISGDVVSAENQYGILSVSPHTFYGVTHYAQYANVTSKTGSDAVGNVTFTFDEALLSGSVWEYVNQSRQVSVSNYSCQSFNDTPVTDYSVDGTYSFANGSNVVQCGSSPTVSLSGYYYNNQWAQFYWVHSQTGEVMVSNVQQNQVPEYFNQSTNFSGVLSYQWVPTGNTFLAAFTPVEQSTVQLACSPNLVASGSHNVPRVVCTDTPYQKTEYYMEWVDRTPSVKHTTYSGKHQYSFLAVPIKAGATRQFKWDYTTAAKSSGKWELRFWTGQCETQGWNGAQCNVIGLLDPWYNSSFTSRKAFRFVESSGNAQTTQPLCYNFTGLSGNSGSKVRFTTNDTVTEVSYETVSEGTGWGVYCPAYSSTASGVNYGYVYYNSSSANNGATVLPYNNNFSFTQNNQSTWWEYNGGAYNSTNTNITVTASTKVDNVDQSFSTDTGWLDMYSWYGAVKFTPTQAKLSGIQLYMAATNVPDAITIELRTDGGNAPNGTILSSVSQTITGGGAWRTIPIVYSGLNASTNYWIRVNKVGNSTHYVSWAFGSGSANTRATSAAGTVWSLDSSTLLYKTFYPAFTTSPLVSSSNSSGNLDFALYRNTTIFTANGNSRAGTAAYNQYSGKWCAKVSVNTTNGAHRLGFSTTWDRGCIFNIWTGGRLLVTTQNATSNAQTDFMAYSANTNYTLCVVKVADKCDYYVDGKLYVSHTSISNLTPQKNFIWWSGTGAGDWGTVWNESFENLMPAGESSNTLSNGTGSLSWSTTFDRATKHDCYESSQMRYTVDGGCGITHPAIDIWGLNSLGDFYQTPVFSAPAGSNLTNCRYDYNNYQANNVTGFWSVDGLSWNQFFNVIYNGVNVSGNTRQWFSFSPNAGSAVVRVNSSTAGAFSIQGAAVECNMTNTSATSLLVLVSGANKLAVSQSQNSSGYQTVRLARREVYYSVTDYYSELPYMSEIGISADPLNLVSGGQKLFWYTANYTRGGEYNLSSFTGNFSNGFTATCTNTSLDYLMSRLNCSRVFNYYDSNGTYTAQIFAADQNMTVVKNASFSVSPLVAFALNTSYVVFNFAQAGNDVLSNPIKVTNLGNIGLHQKLSGTDFVGQENSVYNFSIGNVTYGLSVGSYPYTLSGTPYDYTTAAVNGSTDNYFKLHIPQVVSQNYAANFTLEGSA